MATPSHKSVFAKKLLSFQKKGLQDYGKYLDQQRKQSSGKKLKEQYHKYIEQQIALNEKKIKNIDSKLKTL